MEEEIAVKNVNNKKMKDNIRLYTKYKIVGYDVLFYYAISVLYFTIAKGISMSELFFLTGSYSLFVAIWQAFSNLIVEKIGLKNSIVLGNFLACIMVLLYLVGPSFEYLILANAIGALGFSLKVVGEQTLLYESLATFKKTSLLTKFEGIANSRYFYADAICAIIAGYVFLINAYIPMILCLVCMITALVVSTKFNPTINTSVKHIRVQEYILGFNNIIHSNRTRSLLFFAFLIAGLILAHTILYKAIMLDFNIPSNILAYIVCGYTIIIGIGSKCAIGLERTLKNKTLIAMIIVSSIMLAIIGLIGLTVSFSIPKIVVILLTMIVMGIIVGAYKVLIKKYVTSFTTKNVRTKVLSLYSMAENLGGTVLLFISSIISTHYSNSFTAISISCIVLTLGVIVYKYADKRLGLKPEQYDGAEINYVDISAKM